MFASQGTVSCFRLTGFLHASGAALRRIGAGTGAMVAMYLVTPCMPKHPSSGALRHLLPAGEGQLRGDGAVWGLTSAGCAWLFPLPPGESAKGEGYLGVQGLHPVDDASFIHRGIIWWMDKAPSTLRPDHHLARRNSRYPARHLLPRESGTARRREVPGRPARFSLSIGRGCRRRVRDGPVCWVLRDSGGVTACNTVDGMLATDQPTARGPSTILGGR